MYEQHFGITGLPFKLSPDPFFYFDSDQHRASLQAMRQAFARELPFIVLSGEIGSGKTTILRTWLPELETAGVAVGQIANTQLDADDLMRAIATAFGVEAQSGASGGPDAALRKFLHALDGRQALVVVDEAQNLSHDALQRLTAFADMASAECSAIRICLVGQPELRARIADPTLREFQARVQQSTHLGTLDAGQTRQYIEHRLRKVGWSGTPSFDTGAYDGIHRLTGGVPRRVNVLCNRLLLAQFLSDGRNISAQTVAAAAHALHAEIGEHAFAAALQPFEVEAPRVPEIVPGAILVVVSGRSDQIMAVPLLRAMAARRDLPPAVLVALSDDCTWRLNRDLHSFAAITQQPVALMEGARPQPTGIASSFQQLLRRCHPSAVIIFDGDASSHACATVAKERGVALVHIDSSARADVSFAAIPSLRAAVDQLADLRFGSPCETRVAEGDEVYPFVGAGNLLIDSVHLASQLASQSSRFDEPVPRQYVAAAHGYGIVALKQLAPELKAPCREELLPIVRGLSRDLPLVWPMRQATLLSMRGTSIARSLANDRIACIEELGHMAFIRLLRGATCVLTDTSEVMDEAAALGVACLWFAEFGENDAARRRLPCFAVGTDVERANRAVRQILCGMHRTAPALVPGWDGHAAMRMSAYLARWLAKRGPAVQPLNADHPPGCRV